MRSSDWISDVCSSDLLNQQLLTGRTDMAFAAGPVAHPALMSRPIGKVALVLLASPALAAAFGAGGDAPPVSVWSLASHSPIPGRMRSEEHTSELQSLMRISYAAICLKKNNISRHMD